MNTHSHYKKFASQHKGTKNKEIHDTIPLDKLSRNNMPTHIKLNLPNIKSKQNCQQYTYNIGTIINTSLQDIPNNPSIINFCIYRVITCKNREKISNPFIQYLLYKYPKNNTSHSDLMVFPFIKYKSGSVIKIINSTIKDLTGYKLTIKGFIENNNQLFFFFDLQEIDTFAIHIVNLKTRNEKLWWCIIDEICNKRKVITFPIHPSVYKIFYKNPALIYLKNKDKQITSPVVGFYGNYYKFIPLVAVMGNKKSIREQLSNTDLLYFSTFRKAIRSGSWSPMYTERIAYNKKITDIDGKYSKGGIVRFALFLEKTKVPINKSYTDISNMLTRGAKWDKYYNSLVIASINYNNIELNINSEFILTDPQQYHTLSYHEIDQSTLLPNWEPYYSGYNIL